MRQTTIATLLVVASFLSGLVLTGCDLEQAVQQISQRPAAQPAATTASSNVAVGDTISIASFNIQVFGSSKSKKQHVMEVLAQVVRRFDIVAIQELRSKDTTIVPNFVKRINATGAQYDYIVGPRLGRTSSKEQYIYIFNAARIELDPQPIYTAGDPADLLHREPLVASFRVRGLPSHEAFSFTLINIHTDPDETDTELDALDDVFVNVQSRGEDDVILLGDLNVDYKHLGQLGQLPNITWTVNGEPTNTRRSKSYDNLVFDSTATAEYVGASGVLDLEAEFGLSRKEALEVSDHLPVWAKFSVYEKTSPLVAGRPGAAQPR